MSRFRLIIQDRRGDEAVTKEPTRGERVALGLIDALERFLDRHPFIEEYFFLTVLFVFDKLLDLIRVFAHAKRRWARENTFLEKIGMAFIKRWFRALWKVGWWVFRKEER